MELDRELQQKYEQTLDMENIAKKVGVSKMESVKKLIQF